MARDFQVVDFYLSAKEFAEEFGLSICTRRKKGVLGMVEWVVYGDDKKRPLTTTTRADCLYHFVTGYGAGKRSKK